jgi:dihydropteroate synthase
VWEGDRGDPVPYPIMAAILRLGRFTLDLSRAQVMGVLNVTPDSFADGGRFLSEPNAIERVEEMLADGADIIDIGGESTRPGAAPTTEAEELGRVIPLLQAVRSACDGKGVPISIDTRKPAVMSAAIAAGASMINDVSALRGSRALETVVDTDVGVCLMHMRGEPGNMQQLAQYDDVVAEVTAFLSERASACAAAGVDHDRIVLDPGFGFGKTVEHNLTLLRGLPQIVALGYPVLVGLSRKSTIGALTGRAIDERATGSVAAALAAVSRGASIVRVHDVRETVDALKVWRAVQEP